MVPEAAKLSSQAQFLLLHAAFLPASGTVSVAKVVTHSGTSDYPTSVSHAATEA
jgi:hypothetical protein